jgi:hypothetical protein
MARNARPTAAKREREKNLNVRRQDKAAKRQDVKQRKASEPPPPAGIDPDIADIIAGPQPLADWQIEDPVEESDEDAGAGSLPASSDPVR